MNADRETNRLPYRAGAMLLVAIALVCLGLGIHQLTTGSDDPEAGLKAAGQSAQSAADSESAAPATSQSPSESSASAAPTVDTSDVPKLCVLNAGSITGLASEVTKTLKDAGFDVAETANLSTASVSENTIFYSAGQEDAAKKVADSVPGGADLTERPDVFTRCLGQLAVVVVSR